MDFLEFVRGGLLNFRENNNASKIIITLRQTEPLRNAQKSISNKRDLFQFPGKKKFFCVLYRLLWSEK